MEFKIPLDHKQVAPNDDPTLAERSEMIKRAANTFKYIPQTVSVVTITVILIGLVAQFLNIDPESSLYMWVQITGGIIGLVLGFRLEKAIETFFCYPIHALKEGGTGAVRDPQFIFTTLTTLLLIGLSLFLSLGGKNQAVASRLQFDPTDITKDVKEMMTANSTTFDATKAQLDCEASINQKYDAMVAESKSSARRAKSEADRNWLLVGNVKKLERDRERALRDCASRYADDAVTAQKSVESTTQVVTQLMNLTANNDNIRRQQVEDAKGQYSFYLGYIIWISLPLSLLLYTVIVLSGAKSTTAKKW